MGTKRILVVEDESDVRDLILLHLRREGYQTDWTDHGEEALRTLADPKKFDLVILDWMLPGQSGLEVCKALRRQVPVLMVTARADTSDIVLGLEMGADDYITKPFEVPVLLARVRALLRRSGPEEGSSEAPGPSKVLRAGGLWVDLDAHEAKCDDQVIHLTPSEFKLLTALLHNRGRVLSRERLIELVQGQGVNVVDRAIDTHVFGLRKKLGSCAEVIETIRGVGYRVHAGV